MKLTTNYPKTHAVTEKFKKYVVNQSKAELGRQKKRSSGALKKSIRGIINKKFNRNEKGRFTGGSTIPQLSFEMEHYGKFVDQGVQGEDSSKSVEKRSPYKFRNNKFRVPVKIIREWLRRKGQKKKGLEYAVARSIYQKGIRRSLFFTKPFKRRYKAFTNEYNAALADDIAINVANQIEKILKKRNNIK